MDLRETIKMHYGARVSSSDGCCGGGAMLGNVEVPSYGCGDPSAIAGLQAGETVLDLGSGAGLDVFRAAQAVGESGRVIGVDMTPEMIDRARAAAAQLGLGNVEFRQGYIEDLPLDDESVDVVISNCVVNLSLDKATVFAEAYRALKPGGRVLISDVLRSGSSLAMITPEGWCACEDGAESPERYRRYLAEAGFLRIDVDPPPANARAGETYSALIRAVKPSIRRARQSELREVEEILTGAELPVDGLAQADIFVLEDEGRIKGVVGMERHGDYALLRSLAVAAAARSSGLGRALLRFVTQRARAAGACKAFALTTTIGEWLEREGSQVAWSELPEALFGSAELKGACPESARAFAIDLKSRR